MVPNTLDWIPRPTSGTCRALRPDYEDCTSTTQRNLLGSPIRILPGVLYAEYREPLDNAPWVSALKSALAGALRWKREKASPKGALV